MARKTGDGTPKKKRGFLDGYKTYDTSQGFGTLDDIRATFEAMTGEQAQQILRGSSETPLDILGLTAMPATVRDLKKAYFSLAKKHHPDQGGNAETFIKIEAAYTILKEQLGG